jgi:hypothetical protein
VRVEPQLVGMEHPGRSRLTIPPQPAQEHPSLATITFRVPPSGRTPPTQRTHAIAGEWE